MELGQLALALEQAGAYIEKYRFTFAQYLAEWQERRDKVLAVVQRTADAVSHERGSHLADFVRQSQRAGATTNACLGVARARSDSRVAAGAGGGPFGSEGEDQTQNDSNALDALADLEAHSLVTRADETTSFAVHKLVQDVSRRSAFENGGDVYIKAALRWFNAAFVGDAQDARTWPMLTPIAPHASAVARHADARGSASRQPS